ncbi:hypothetical protein BGZ65_007447, partial [Modicella reniformis]
MDKHGSMLLLRTLFQGCMDPSKTTFPYARFARSVNLKWIHDTFDLPEVDIQTLTGFRWTRNETPKDFLIRHLLANRPYLSDFVHCHAPRLPRCLFAHMTTTVNLVDDVTAAAIAAATVAATTATVEPVATVATVDGGGAADNTPVTEESVSGEEGGENTNTINDDNTASIDSDDDFVPGFDMSLLATPPLLPVQQPIATAMPLVHTVAASSSTSELSQLDPGHHNTPTSFLQVLDSNSTHSTPVEYPLPPPITFATALSGIESQPTMEMINALELMEQAPTSEVENVIGANATSQVVEEIMDQETESDMAGILESTFIEPHPQANGQVVQSLTAVLASATSSTIHLVQSETQPVFAFQQPYVPSITQSHSRATSSTSVGPSRLFLATWPLTIEQTRSLVFLDLRYAIVSDALIVSLSNNCRRIEFLKVATHWQHYSHTYSVTDHALAYLVAAQHGLKLVHVENHREISQGHELIRTIDALTRMHGSTLETLVLKSHDFQNCNLAALGKACQKLVKFSAPGGVHLFREEIVKLTEACKLTLEHLDFSNSDIETESLMNIMKGMSTPAAKGVLKALVLLGMEDTLNQETCLAIGEHGSGLNCFRLDILESEAKDVGLMLRRPCAANLRVITLGCHDVHGDLGNDILEQIALNCRNVELLDVNHWQFTAKAIENVLRECGMLRYLNVSYTDISESTADIICKCLGQVKVDTTMPSSSLHVRPEEDSLSIPPLTTGPSLSPPSVSLQTSAILQANSQRDPPNVAPMQQEMNEEETLAALDQEAGGDVVETVEEERPEVLKKRGVETKLKDEGEDDDGEYMDTNMDSEQQHVTPMYSTNSVGKKQSQMGLVHHHHLNAMDLRTIMNLDLDEATETDLAMTIDEDFEMDLDMCLDLKRYYGSGVFNKVGKYGVGGDGDDEEEVEQEQEEGKDGEQQEQDCSMVDEDVEMMDDHIEDDEEITRPREPKGKEVYVDRNDSSSHLDEASLVLAPIMSTYSSS